MAGRKTKDAEVTENFNPVKKGGMTRKEEAQAKRIAKIEKEQEKLKKKQAELEILKREKQLETAKVKAGVEVEDVDEEKDDEKSAYEMLQHMRWVYRKVGSKQKLKEMVVADDKQFVFLVKELMKIETALLTKAKEGIGPQQQTVFVVLKGLDETPKNITEKSIANILTPDGADYEVHD